MDRWKTMQFKRAPAAGLGTPELDDQVGFRVNVSV